MSFQNWYIIEILDRFQCFSYSEFIYVVHLFPYFLSRVQGVVPSQLCKSTLFAEFQRVAQLYGRDDLLQANTYHGAKAMAVEFEAAKKYMKESFKKGGYGVWIEKPIEEELFSL